MIFRFYIISGLFLFFLVSCGYSFAARPPLPGNISKLSVPIFENNTPEADAGMLMARALAGCAEAEGRLVGRGVPDARLTGRIERIRAVPVTFPAATGGAGMYALDMRVRIRLVKDGNILEELTVSGREHYLAGYEPEETEAGRRLALERLSKKLAEDAWKRLTAPR